MACLPPFFSLFPCVCLSFPLVCPLVVLFLLPCLSCLFVLFLWVFVFSFSLSDYEQKERARRVGASSLGLLWVVVMRLIIVRGLPAIPFRLLRDSVRNCSNVGGSRQNRGNLMR